ncbi:hypothetical protein B0H19DRAFT_1118444 [Mycena capillaripes]|nr:hypothetical protein B0H19DRAFT_1118444 [Mycena capillaripes]
MFASSYAPYVPQYQRPRTLSPRERYVSAISRVQEAEIEYAAYLAQQERIRALQAQQRRNEQARAAAVKRMQIIVLHAAVSSLLSGRDEPQVIVQPPVQRQVAKPTPTPTQDCGAQLRRNRVRPVRLQPQQTKSIADVQTALKRRLASEPNVEVHATIQNILSNLSTTPTPAAPAPAISKSAAAVYKVARTFRTLATEFAFPTQLDFTPSASGGYLAAQLPYTPRNAPVRHYEHALNGLLAQLDAIDSEGDAAVRRQRKFVVGMVEKALEELDRIVEGRWKLQDTRARGPDGASSSKLASAVVNNDSAVAASTSIEPGLASTQEDTSRPASPTREPVEINEQEERSSSPGLPSVEVQGEEGSQGESSQVSPPTLADEATETETHSESQTAEVPRVPETELPAPESESEKRSESRAAALVATENLAVDSPSSPKSLSIVTPIPDEDLVVVDSEEKEDTESVYSASSWELED